MRLFAFPRTVVPGARCAACALLLTLLGGCAGGTRHGPAAEVRRTRIGGAMPALPSGVSAGPLVATYRVCVDLQSGSVQQVEPVAGVAGGDEAIMTALRTWTWLIEAPPAGPSRLCFIERLRFPGRKDKAPPPDAPAIEYRLAPGAALPEGRSISFRRKRRLAAPPDLPAELRQRLAGRPLGYKVCVEGATGKVVSTTPAPGLPEADAAITQALMGWSYQVTWPAVIEEICFREELRLDQPGAR